jgi:hypothetical protein
LHTNANASGQQQKPPAATQQDFIALKLGRCLVNAAQGARLRLTWEIEGVFHDTVGVNKAKIDHRPVLDDK